MGKHTVYGPKSSSLTEIERLVHLKLDGYLQKGTVICKSGRTKFAFFLAIISMLICYVYVNVVFGNDIFEKRFC